MAILDIKDLCVTYHSGSKLVKAVDHVSLCVDEGDSLGIVGESGSGKSTLCMAVLRMLDPRVTDITGSVRYKGQELLTMGIRELNRLR